MMLTKVLSLLGNLSPGKLKWVTWYIKYRSYSSRPFKITSPSLEKGQLNKTATEHLPYALADEEQSVRVVLLNWSSQILGGRSQDIN